jgi:hypothetical protein
MRPSATTRPASPRGLTRLAGPRLERSLSRPPPLAHVKQPMVHEPKGLRERYECQDCDSTVSFYSPTIEVRVEHDPTCVWLKVHGEGIRGS